MVIRKAGVKDEDRTLQQTVPTDATRWQQSTALVKMKIPNSLLCSSLAPKSCCWIVHCCGCFGAACQNGQRKGPT